MKNFIFKSNDSDLTKISFSMKLVLDEQRAQRIDLAMLLKLLRSHINDSKLQSEVDDFHASDRLEE